MNFCAHRLSSAFFASILLSLVFSCSSGNVRQTILVNDEDGPNIVRLAPDVSSRMLEPSFWISRSKNPYKVKMSRDEIAAWNRDVLTRKQGNFHILSDLRKFDSVMTAIEIRDGMFRHTSKNQWYKKITEKGEEKVYALKSKDWKAVYSKMNYAPLGSFRYFSGGRSEGEAALKKDYPLRKAVCVRRCDIRLIPDSSFYSESEDVWYDDLAQNSGLLMNEPLLVLWESEDGNWYYIKTSFCTGWVRSSDVAFCSDRQFERYFDYAEKKPASFVTVTADRFILPSEYVVPSSDPDFSGVPEFFMGTYLFTADWDSSSSFKDAFLPRLPYASFIVEIPYRKKDGSLSFAYASLPAGVCTKGLCDYSQANVITLAFKSLGIRYGWGGMSQSRDCSEYMKDIFRCFGFTFPRNSRSQLEVGGKTVDFEKKSLSEKSSVLSTLEGGTFLGFPGHVFMYLGNVCGKNYVISALGSYYELGEESLSDSFFPIDANSVSINTLDVKRKSGKSWLDMLSKAKILEADGSFSDRRIFLDQKWKFAEFSKINSGASFLYKSDSNRKGITVAVNAGHGTRGGDAVKTYSHPDKSPKLTGGTSAKGAVESISVSGGMTFKDGKDEASVNLRQARLLKKLLLKNGYDVLMIRDDSNTQLDNIARTVIANNNARIHIAIHFDGDSEKSDKGCFYCSIPEELKKLPNVKKHFKESSRLGDCLIWGLTTNEFLIYKNGKMSVDLTQTSYSTIPSVDIELGNEWTDTSTEELEKRAKALLDGINLFFDAN